MSLLVLSAGTQTTVQDLGRTGHMHLGVCRGGAADPLSLMLANALVGNPENTPVIEICFAGPVLQAQSAVTLAVCGAEFVLTVNQQRVDMAASIHLQAGDVLAFGQRLRGLRAYLAVAGEWRLTPLLGGYGTHIMAGFGGVAGRALTKGDIIPITPLHPVPRRRLPQGAQRYVGSHVQLRIMPGVEQDMFDEPHRKQLCATRYLVAAEVDRMGLRLKGPSLDTRRLSSMRSSGLMPGAVQVPPSGLPIIMSVDAQTLGGYPRIAQVISADLPALGQLFTGDRVSFQWVTRNQAKAIYCEQRQRLQEITDNIVKLQR